MAREEPQPASTVQSALQTVALALRVAAAALGLAAIFVGLTYAIRIFGAVAGALGDPNGFQTHLETWMAAVGGESTSVELGEVTLRPARVLALAVLGGGSLVLAWLSIAILVAGAKTLSWTLGDQEAVRRLLIHAFGPGRKPSMPTSATRDGRSPATAAGVPGTWERQGQPPTE
jgi:hypothetical protein